MTTMESPQIQVTSYDDTNKKVQDDDDDLDKELESFIATRTVEERKVCIMQLYSVILTFLRLVGKGGGEEGVKCSLWNLTEFHVVSI